MNTVYLQARVLRKLPFRHSPAGVPIQECVLEHSAEVVEAGFPRRIDFQCQAIAIGPLGSYLRDTLQIGQTVQVQGFLAPLKHNSPRLCLHLQTVSIS